MTRPSPEAVPSEKPPTSDEVRELVAGVGKLAKEVKSLADQQALDRADVGTVKRRQRGDRWKIAFVTLGLAADLVLSGLFIYQHQQQSCTNHRSQEFFAAEVAKVSGQVRGLNEIQTHPLRGIAQFKRASENYLVTIGDLQEHC